MAPGELAAVLRALLAEHPDLRTEAESIATAMVSSPCAEDVAADVFDAVTSLGIESLHGRAGRTPWGYVEPSEAAWNLLHEAVEDFFDDMRRRIDLGLNDAVEATCCGIVIGLYRSRAHGAGSDGPLGWAQDFPSEEACAAIAELIRAFPAQGRGAARDRLAAALGDSVPEWDAMIARAAERAANKR